MDQRYALHPVAHACICVWVGVTEPGSSGSPLFNSKGQVIGHLHGGQSSCDYPVGYDLYGAFSSDWTAPPNANTKLSNWLNPAKVPIGNMNGSRLNAIRTRPHINGVVTPSHRASHVDQAKESDRPAAVLKANPFAASFSQPQAAGDDNKLSAIEQLPSLPLMNPK